MNEYSGYIVGSDAVVDRVPADVDARKFFDEYIAKRKPCIITGLLDDPAWTADQKWTDFAYLRKHAGHAMLSVEPRDSTKDMFGKGRKEQMTFGALLDLLEGGNELYYLTTQELKMDPKTGFVDVHASPVTDLINDIPLRPRIMGRLVPQQVNLWMGNNRDGSTSGLHHDFHDNIYVLLRGRKRFTLYSPADLEKMHVRGKVAKVHSNGRIVYEGTPETRADGVEIGSRVHATDRLRTAESKIASLEKRVQEAQDRGDDAEAERLTTMLEEEEAKLEDALVGVMDYEDADDGAEVDADEYLSDLGEENEDEESAEEEQDEGEEEEGAAAASAEAPDGAKAAEPPSFSLVGSVGRPKKDIEAEFPDFFDAKPLVADIKAGEMLFLPAGWFHEVHSFGESLSTDVPVTPSIHMAVNYWFHPIDTADFDAPYADPLWERLWKSRGLPEASVTLDVNDIDEEPLAKRPRRER